MTAIENKIRVLVVDDDPHVRTVVVIHLQQLGFDVASASNGMEALNLLGGINGAKRYDADVVLLDLLMPVMDGYDFLAKYGGPVPVIVMSGLGDIAALPRQPFALVVKPMSMFTVADTLREAAEGQPCTCSCHTDGGVMHFVDCCGPCPHCGRDRMTRKHVRLCPAKKKDETE